MWGDVDVVVLLYFDFMVSVVIMYEFFDVACSGVVVSDDWDLGVVDLDGIGMSLFV